MGHTKAADCNLAVDIDHETGKILAVLVNGKWYDPFVLIEIVEKAERDGPYPLFEGG